MEFVIKKESFELTARKTSYEERWINGDFTEDLPDGVSISSYTITCEDKNGEDTSDIMLDSLSNPEEAWLKAKVKGGTKSNSPYLVRFRIDASDSQKLEIFLPVTIF